MNNVQIHALSVLLCGLLAGCNDGSGPSQDVVRPATSQLPAAAVNARGVDYPNTHWRGPSYRTRGGGRHAIPAVLPKATTKVTPPPPPVAASAGTVVPGPSASPSATSSANADLLQERE